MKHSALTSLQDVTEKAARVHEEVRALDTVLALLRRIACDALGAGSLCARLPANLHLDAIALQWGDTAPCRDAAPALWTALAHAARNKAECGKRDPYIFQPLAYALLDTIPATGVHTLLLNAILQAQTHDVPFYNTYLEAPAVRRFADLLTARLLHYATALEPRE